MTGEGLLVGHIAVVLTVGVILGPAGSVCLSLSEFSDLHSLHLFLKLPWPAPRQLKALGSGVRSMWGRW